MKKFGNAFILLLLLMMSAFMVIGQPVFAISESEVQAQVDAIGKEAVSGNILIWFLCAVAFLRVSQKIDSFMSSLGINVGHTGGSMAAEAMIAFKGVASAKNFSNQLFRGGFGGNTNINHKSGGTGGDGRSGFLSGGLVGAVSRNVTEGARKSAVKPSPGSDTDSQGKTISGMNGRVQAAGGEKGINLYGGSIGGRMYASSLSRGGDFANNVISTVATGSINAAGSITGAKAAQALQSYLGNAALEPGAANIPQFSGVEIGGGRITGTETSKEHPEGIAFGMYHTAQYAQPEGNFSTVQTKDGASWYKQYAADKVDKSPYMTPDGSIAYKESIIKKLPPPPIRKERM